MLWETTDSYFSGEGQNAIFSMAGDGLTEVEIGSAFLPSKESDVLLKAFAQNRDVTIAISHTRIDVQQLHKNISTEQVSGNSFLIKFIKINQKMNETKRKIALENRMNRAILEHLLHSYMEFIARSVSTLSLCPLTYPLLQSVIYKVFNLRHVVHPRGICLKIYFSRRWTIH